MEKALDLWSTESCNIAFSQSGECLHLRIIDKDHRKVDISLTAGEVQSLLNEFRCWADMVQRSVLAHC